MPTGYHCTHLLKSISIDMDILWENMLPTLTLTSDRKQKQNNIHRSKREGSKEFLTNKTPGSDALTGRFYYACDYQTNQCYAVNSRTSNVTIVYYVIFLLELLVMSACCFGKLKNIKKFKVILSFFLQTNPQYDLVSISNYPQFSSQGVEP